MINPYNSIIGYSKSNLKEHLDKIGVLGIFEPLLKTYDGPVFIGVVKFILYSYSLESELLHTGGTSWIGLQRSIFEKCDLPDHAFDEVANLKSPEVRESIELWLAYQNNEAFVEYTNARDLRRYCLQQSQTADKTKERVDAMKYAKECQAMMEDAKSRFVENYDHLKPSLNALKKEKQKNTLGPQDYAT